ncbi:hypothetical protein GCM10027613_37320 [Microlunatus endophyticus]
MRLPAARLHYALGDILLDLGDAAGGYREFVAAADLDTDGETDAQERVDALDGLDIDFDDSEDDDQNQDQNDNDGDDHGDDHGDTGEAGERDEEPGRAD